MYKPFVILLVLLIASASNAIIDETPNAIGFYWDENADVVDEVYYTPFMTGHLLITNPTFATFKAVELELSARDGSGNEISSDGIIAGIPAAMGQVLSVGSLPNIIYSTANPVATTSDIFEIYTLTFLTSEQGLDSHYICNYTNFFINPTSFIAPTIDGAVVALPATGEDFIQLYPVAPYGSPCAILEPNWYQCSVPVENTSWGTVRSLYR